jgi:predicted RNA-binding Zn-ribbon protein involved in translation (DUF1610 family)
MSETEMEAGPGTLDLRAWEPQRRRTSSLVALTVAVVAIVASLAVYYTIGDKAWLDWSLVVVLALVLLFLVLLMVLAPSAARARAPESAEAEAHLGPAAPGAVPAQEAPAGGTITLRCGDCGTVFDIQDTGERPLYHTCPGCGAQGVLRSSELEPASPPAPVDVPAPPPTPQPAPVLQAPRRLKLRCGGCKEVFVIEDTGERPLRRPCPHCGRMGEIR